MVRVLEGAPDIVLFGCGGGALASELHNRGCRVTVVDDNPICFEIARRYFWMPSSILCVADGMTEFLEKGSGEYAAVGVDVGGPSFDYQTALSARACALLARSFCERRQDCRQHCAQLGSGHYPRAHCGQALQCGPRCGDFRRSSGQGSKRPYRGDQTDDSDEWNCCDRVLIGLPSRARRRSLAIASASWLDVGVDLDQDDDPRHTGAKPPLRPSHVWSIKPSCRCKDVSATSRFSTWTARRSGRGRPGSKVSEVQALVGNRRSMVFHDLSRWSRDRSACAPLG